MARRTIAVLATALTGLLLAPLAHADTANILEPQHHPATAADGFQAGPCTGDTPKCAPDTPAQFFKAAGGHPPVGFVQFNVRHEVRPPFELEPNFFVPVEPLVQPIESRAVKTVRVDLPPGLSVNPEATLEKCTLAEFLHEEKGAIVPQCKPGSRIGESQVKVVAGPDGWPLFGLPPGVAFPPLNPLAPGLTQLELFNLQPSSGEPALFGFVVAASIPVLLKPEVAWQSDFHESFTIEGLPDYNTAHVGALPAPVVIHDSRLVTFGDAGNGTLATNPTTCFNSDEVPFRHLYSSWIREDSFGEPDPAFPLGSTPLESALPAGVHPEGCEFIPFSPSIEVSPGTADVDSAASPTVTTRLDSRAPGQGGGPIAQSHLRRAEVTLPEGMALNPGGSAGLLACSDEQFRKGVRELENACPAGSAIGTAEVRTPVLSQPLQGEVYVGEPKSGDPASGEEFRAFVEAKSGERGIAVRLIGNVRADPASGRLTAVFDEQETSPLFGDLPRGLPQLPFESLSLHFHGDHRILSSPPTCSPSTTTSQLEPWARPGDHATPTAAFSLSSIPSDGRCPQTLDQRPFAPGYTAQPDTGQAGAYTPFRFHLKRPPGQQELKRISLSLPPGVIGRLAGIPYCPEGAIAAAPGRSGAAERESPSCPAESIVGTTATESGTGDPLRLPGKVYLAGPYRGASLSLVSITPAISGPFDLGDVVVRVALGIDPRSAQVSAVSDLLPHVFGGVKLDLRGIAFDLDRGHFTLNPTNCSEKATTGTIAGGGGDPANPAAFSSFGLRAPFQATGCGALGFQPTLTTTLSGPTRRAKYPQLTATLAARPGDANVAGVDLTLPHSFFVAQEHISTVCTRPQLASRSCPAASVYGEAEASSPLLDGKLSGPVYLVPGGHRLPDLVVDLHGQVDIQLEGVVSSSRGRIRTAFESAPDVPLREFTLRMAGGKKGLIVNSTNICKKRRPAALTIQAQNGKQLKNNRYKLRLPGCRKRRKVHVRPHGRGGGVVPHPVVPH